MGKIQLEDIKAYQIIELLTKDQSNC
jgi:hypothetical protein